MKTSPDISLRGPHVGRGRLWLLAVLFFVLFRAIPNISYPLGHDQSTFCVMGEGLLRGQQLYRDMWDNKPPGIFAVYAGIVRVFGHAMWSAGLVDIVWLLLISICIFWFARRYLGTAEAVVAVLVNAVWHCRIGYVDAAQPESFLTLLVFAAYFTVCAPGRWPLARQFAAGLMFGGAFWLKYNALAFLPLVAVVPYVEWQGFDVNPKQLRGAVSWHTWGTRTCGLLAGFAAAIAAVLSYFWWKGSWAALVEIQFKVLPRYGAMAVQGIPHYWAYVIGESMAWLGIGTLLATGISVLVAERFGLSRFLPVLAAAGMGYAATASQARFHHYAFETCYPFFAMIWGYLAVKTYEGVRAGMRKAFARRPRMAGVLKWSVMGIMVLLAGHAEPKAMVERYRELLAWDRNPGQFYAHYPALQLDIEYMQGQLEVICRVRQESALRSGLFVWGTDPLIYFLTQQFPPTRFVSNLALISPWGQAAWREELLHDLKKSPPGFIVVAQNDAVPDISFTTQDSEQCLTTYPSLAEFISDSYERVGDFPNFLLYRLKSPPDIH
jgi:hypothetical protein